MFHTFFEFLAKTLIQIESYYLLVCMQYKQNYFRNFFIDATMDKNTDSDQIFYIAKIIESVLEAQRRGPKVDESWRAKFANLARLFT
jgi:hypothetical protein